MPTGLLLITLGWAQDMTWTCLEVDDPADALPYRESDSDYGVRSMNEGMLARMKEWAMGDCAVETCTLEILEIESFSYYTSCTVTTCMTPGGGTAALREEHNQPAYDTYNTAWWGTITPGATDGVTWTSLSWDWTSHRFWDGYTQWDDSTWNATWIGTLDPAWPADTSISVISENHDASWLATVWSKTVWADPGCTWSVTTEAFGGEPFSLKFVETVELEDDVVQITTYDSPCGIPTATFNGVDAGSVDPETWEPKAYDLDGDGYSAPVFESSYWLGCEDCDDTNPHIYPNQPDLHCDGVDQNCDWEDCALTMDGTSEPNGRPAPDTATPVDTSPAGPSDTEPPDSSTPDTAAPLDKTSSSDGCGSRAGTGLLGLGLLARRRRRARQPARGRTEHSSTERPGQKGRVCLRLGQLP